MSTLTDQEKAALLVLFGKSTKMGKTFANHHLRALLLIADGIFQSSDVWMRTQRLAADVQRYHDECREEANAVMDMEAKRDATEFEQAAGLKYNDDIPRDKSGYPLPPNWYGKESWDKKPTAEEQNGGVTVPRDEPEFKTHPQEQFPDDPEDNPDHWAYKRKPDRIPIDQVLLIQALELLIDVLKGKPQ